MALADTPEKKAAVNAAEHRVPKLAKRNTGAARAPSLRVQPVSSMAWATTRPMQTKASIRERGKSRRPGSVAAVTPATQARPAASTMPVIKNPIKSIRPLFFFFSGFKAMSAFLGYDQGPVIGFFLLKHTNIADNLLTFKPAFDNAHTFFHHAGLIQGRYNVTGIFIRFKKHHIVCMVADFPELIPAHDTGD